MSRLKLPARLIPSRTTTALLLATCVVACRPTGDDYPRDWPPLAGGWGCPDLSGQWRVDDLGLIKDVPLVLVMGETHVRWDAMAISFDANKRMTMRFVRGQALASEPDDVLPLALRPYAARRLGKVLSREEQATHHESSLDRDLYQCSGGKLMISHGTAGGEAPTIYLARDKQGGLVAERVERRSESIKINPEAEAIPLGRSTKYRWAHWAALTPAQFNAVSTTAHAAEQIFDAGPKNLGPAGSRDVDEVRSEAMAELEGGAKVVSLTAAGSGAVLATIQGANEWAIRSALDRVASTKYFGLDLRRYDPTHPGAFEADVLLTPPDSSTHAALSSAPTPADAASAAPGLEIGQAQAAVLANLPDAVAFKSLATSHRGFLLHAHAASRDDVALAIRMLTKSGRFTVYPETPDRVTLDTGGVFALELTPRR